MAKKVLKVDMVNGYAVVGDEERETMETISLDDFSFVPSAGDRVKIYRNENSLIIEKAGREPMTRSMEYSEDDVPKHEVNKILYAVFGVMFGCFGIHHFYAGHTKTGLKYLLAFLLLSWTVIAPVTVFILSLLDVVKVLKMREDEYGNVIV